MSKKTKWRVITPRLFLFWIYGPINYIAAKVQYLLCSKQNIWIIELKIALTFGAISAQHSAMLKNPGNGKTSVEGCSCTTTFSAAVSKRNKNLISATPRRTLCKLSTPSVRWCLERTRKLHLKANPRSQVAVARWSHYISSGGSPLRLHPALAIFSTFLLVSYWLSVIQWDKKIVYIAKKS